ncbi:hypothetical protein ACFLZQ_02325 [Thermodesulfobacteriota bacterium]
MISKLYTRQLYQTKPSGIIDNTIIFFIAITVVILYCALDKPIWYDELVQFCLAAFSSVDSAWHALKPTLKDWNHGQTGFYFLLDYFLLKLFGASSYALRLPSILSALWLLASAIIIIKYLKFGLLWQILILSAFFSQSFLMNYTMEARSYMPLAAASVGITAYYYSPTHLRKKLYIKSIGWGSVVLGSLMHPYFSLYWCALFCTGYLHRINNNFQRITPSTIVDHLNPVMFLTGITIYFGIGFLTWMQGSNEFQSVAIDPFQFIKLNQIPRILFSNHFQFIHFAYIAKTIFALFCLIPIVWLLVPSRNKNNFHPLLSPIILFFISIILSLLITYISYSRGYWITNRQWIASLALVPIATVWLAGELARLANLRHWIHGFSVMLVFTLLITLPAIIQIDQNLYQIKENSIIKRKQNQSYRLPPLNQIEQLGRTDPDEFIKMANKNIQIGGPVWPYFKYFYTRTEGWHIYWRPSPNK